MKDLYTVQEFSKLSGVETTTLRYWDDIGLFSPLKRNPENNYRYYSLSQMLALNFVTTLSDLEFPLKTIAELRKQRDPKNILSMLGKKEKQMDKEMRQLQQRYAIIHARRELINFGVKMDETKIEVAERGEMEIILWPPNEYNEGDTFVEPLANFVRSSGDFQINLSFPVGGYYESMDSFMANPKLPERFFSIDPIGRQRRREGKYLIGYTRGDYAEMGDLPARMASYAQENSLEVFGPVYTIYLLDEICTHDPSNYLAQSCVAISQRRNRDRRHNAIDTRPNPVERRRKERRQD
ncbi:MAG: MerR family transcriptional regulator [Clostridiales bacterium]|nr:MerR family transcriptional regulator [Clostridiales bacterium]